jgi:hypothetical protein
MKLRSLFWACPLILTIGIGGSAKPGPPKTKFSIVSRANLCVTEGAITELPDHWLSVAVPKMRAYLNATTPQRVEGRFIGALLSRCAWIWAGRASAKDPHALFQLQQKS